MANSVKINVDVVTNITGQDNVKKLQDSLNALTVANNSRVKSEKAQESAVKQRSVFQIAEEYKKIAAANKVKQAQIDAYNASIAAYTKEASSLNNITRLSQHKASIELEAAKQKKNITEAAAKQEKSLASETQKAQKYAHNFTKIEVKMGIDGAKARAKAEKEAAKEAEKANKAEIKANNEKIKQEQELKKLSEQRLSSAVSSESALASKAQSSFSRIKDIALGTLAGIGLDDMFGNIGEQLSTATTNASSIVESENLLRATYNEGADALLNWADANAEAYGLANASAKQYLSFLTGVLNNTDISSDKLGSMAQNYTRLVGDMASAYNTEIDDAFQAIRSGIAGNTLAMQRYGVVLSVTNLQQYLQSKGIDATYRSLDAASKQYVRYAYIMEHTAEIQGDYTRTSESFANSVKTLKNEWNNFLSLLGQYAIPMLMPIINALRTIIAYAGEVLKYIASIYGWEQYTTIAVDYSYQQAENIEDAVDSQEDLTKEVKNTNKALKSGVKLLDLYSLDFSDASDAASASSAGTTPEKSPVSAQLEDLANIEYNAPESILPEINVDPAKVKAIGDTIAGVINTVDELLSNIKTSVTNFLEEPWYKKAIDIILAGINLLVLKWIKDKAPTWLATVFSTKAATLKTGTKTLLAGIGSSILLGISSWNLGEAIAKGDLFSGLTSAIGAALGGGLLLTKGGLYSAIFAEAANSGMMFTSVLGKAAAAATGLFSVFVVGTAVAAIANISAMVTKFSEVRKNVEEIATGSVSLTSIFASSELSTGLQDFIDKADGAAKSFDSVKSSAEDALIGVDAVLDGSLTLPEGQTTAEYLTEKFKALNDEYNTYIETTAKPVSEAFVNSLTGPGGILEGSETVGASLKQTLNTMLDMQAQDLSGATAQLNELLSKDNRTAEDEARIEFLKNKISSLTDQTATVASDIESQFADADLTSLDKVYAKANELRDDYFSSLDAQARDFQKQIDLANLTLSSEGATEEEKAKARDSINFYTELLNSIELQKRSIEAEISKQTEELEQKVLNEADERLYKVAGQIVLDLDLKPGESAEDVKAAADDILSESGKTLEGQLHEWGFSEEDLEGKTQLEKQQMLVETLVLQRNMAYGDIDNLNFGVYSKYVQDTVKNALSGFYGDLGANVEFTDYGLEASLPGTISQRLGFEVSEPSAAEIKANHDSLVAAMTKINKPAAESAGKTMGDDVANSAAEATKSEENTQKVQEAATELMINALSNVETPEEAKEKGSDIATSLASGLTSGLKSATSEGSDFINAADNLKQVISGIASSFDSSFKSAVNNIAGYINSLVNGLKQQLNGLNLPEGELTVAQLYESLKGSNFKIPMLANGGVIPANNPFLAVLGDQKSGVNIEAPVTVIQDAVRNVVNEPGTSDNIEVKVYIGDREIRDFVIDTVTANNLVVG